MSSNWWSISTGQATGVIVTLVAVYLSIILLTRIAGLRSFSKMSASDFAMTVAVGSLFASAITSPDPTIGVAVLALAGLFAGQFLLAFVRRHSALARKVLDNEPVLLMDGRRLLRENLDRTNVSEADVRAKLREANVLNLDQVRAVVLETTGDVSVLHSSSAERLDDYILEDVRS